MRRGERRAAGSLRPGSPRPEGRRSTESEVYDDGTNTFFWRAHTLTVLFILTCALGYVTLLEETPQNTAYNTKRSTKDHLFCYNSKGYDLEPALGSSWDILVTPAHTALSAAPLPLPVRSPWMHLSWLHSHHLLWTPRLHTGSLWQPSVSCQGAQNTWRFPVEKNTYFVMLRIKPKLSYMPGKCSTLRYVPAPRFFSQYWGLN